MKTILIILLSFLALNSSAQSDVYGKNIRAKDTITGRYLGMIKQTYYPSAPRVGMVINYLDTLKTFNGSAWVLLGGSMPDTTTLIETRYHAEQTYLAKTLAGKVTRVPFYDASNTINTSASFAYDSTNKVLSVTKNNLATIPTGGLVLDNLTAATVSVKTQVSPAIILKSNIWDVDDAIQRTSSMSISNSYSLTGVSPETGLIIKGSNDGGNTYANALILSHRPTNNSFGFTFTGSGTFSGSLTASGLNSGQSTVIRNTIGNTRAIGWLYTNTTVTNGSTRLVERSPTLTFTGNNWNGSANRINSWDVSEIGITGSENSELVTKYSYDGGTNFKSLFGIRGTYGVSTANNFWMSEGASQASPNLSITSAGKSTAIGATASNSHIIADNTGNLTIGFDSKTNIDARVGTPATVGTIVNNTGLMYRRSIAADSVYYVKKDVDKAIDFALTGTLESKGNWSVAGGTLPSSGVLTGDKYTITNGTVFITPDSFYTGDVIIAKIDNPGQTVSNWNHIYANQPKTVTIVAAGSSVNPSVIGYSGLTSVDGYMNGGTTAPLTTTTRRLNIYANTYVPSLNVTGVSTFTRGIVIPSSTVYNKILITHVESGDLAVNLNISGNGFGYGTNNSSTGISFYARNTAAGTGKPYSYYKENDELYSVDNTGKGTFNGGVVSTGVPLDSNYIKWKGGQYNSFIGLNNGYNSSSNSEGNTFVGGVAGYTNTSGDFNTFIGMQCGLYNITGNNNTFIGRAVGQANVTGSNNIYIGYDLQKKKWNSNNILLIDNKNDSNTTFIAGDMLADTLRINAQTRIGKGAKYFEIDTEGLPRNNIPHIALYRNTDLTITATQNIWYKFTGMTAKDADYITLTGDSIQLTKSGHYLVSFTTSFGGLNNEVWEIGVFKNNVLEEPSQLRYTSSGDVGNMSIPVYISSDGDDWFSFRIRNTVDNDDPTIKRISIIVSTIHLNL